MNSVLHIHLPFLTPPLGPLKGTFGSFLSQTEHLPSRTCFSSRAPAQKAHPLCSVVGVRDGGSAWAATSSFPSSYPNQPPHPVDFTFKMPLNPSRQLFSRFTHLAVPQSTFFCLVTAGDQCTQRFPHFCSCLSRTHQSLSAEAGLSGGLTAPPPKGLPAALRTKTIPFLGLQSSEESGAHSLPSLSPQHLPSASEIHFSPSLLQLLFRLPIIGNKSTCPHH